MTIVDLGVELKPCPCCGSDWVELEHLMSEETELSIIYRRCTELGKMDYAYPHGVWRVRCDNSDCSAGGGWFDNKADAIAAWNRRASIGACSG